MNAYEATEVVLSRIQNLDPENASKIMGYILIQDQGDKDMIRLAFGPETVLISLINQAKNRLGLSSNSSSAPLTPSFPSPFTNACKFNPFPQSSPRIMIPNNGFSSAPASPWSGGSPVFSRSPRPVITSESYATAGNGSKNTELNEEYCNIQVQDDVFLGGSPEDDNGGFGGWRPCMYYARGFCKNGNSCKFVHGGFGDYSPDGSPNEVDYFDELLRVKASQQQRFAQFMGSGGHHHHPFAYNKCMNILNDNQRSAAAALMISNEFHKYGGSLPDRNEFSAMALGGNSNSCLRQIYLTFPADSTFKEEDVSTYFSMYGPVQDVRIPYQQKRMFGFVTFVYPETVKLILAKGNPHFVCDSRVLVKPYKEKGKILEKKQQYQFTDRGELSACLGPSDVESGELYDTPFGARMFRNSHEMMLRRRIEQDAELQQAVDVQGRRLMTLQLMDMKNPHRDNHFQPSPSPGVLPASQMQPQYQNSQGLVCSSNGISEEVIAENNGVQEPTEPPVNVADKKVAQEIHTNNGNGSRSMEKTSDTDDSDLRESLEHILPDNLFASPKKSAAEQHVVFSTASAEADTSSPISATATTTATLTSTNNIPMLPATSTFNMASVKSCYFQMPRLISGQEASES